jgi:hypothetical protein
MRTKQSRFSLGGSSIYKLTIHTPPYSATSGASPPPPPPPRCDTVDIKNWLQSAAFQGKVRPRVFDVFPMTAWPAANHTAFDTIHYGIEINIMKAQLLLNYLDRLRTEELQAAAVAAAAAEG